MFNVEKVDLKTTQLKPFVYPPDATAEYTIVDENATSKWRYPKEVAEAVAGGCMLGYAVGYEARDYSFNKESIMAWFSAYALIRSGAVDKLAETIRRNLSEQGFGAELAVLNERFPQTNTEGK